MLRQCHCLIARVVFFFLFFFLVVHKRKVYLSINDILDLMKYIIYQILARSQHHLH